MHIFPTSPSLKQMSAPMLLSHRAKSFTRVKWWGLLHAVGGLRSQSFSQREALLLVPPPHPSAPPTLKSLRQGVAGACLPLESGKLLILDNGSSVVNVQTHGFNLGRHIGCF